MSIKDLWKDLLAAIASPWAPLNASARKLATEISQLTTLEQRLAAVEAAIANGVNEIELAGERIAFASTRELQQERERIRRLLDKNGA